MRPDSNAPGAMSGAELAATRHNLGLSQSQLAELLDVPVNTLARWERGEVVIRHSRILALALQALAKSLSESAVGQG